MGLTDIHDDRTHLVIMIVGRVKNGNVTFVQSLARALEPLINLVCHCQAGGTCAVGGVQPSDGDRAMTDRHE